MNTHEFRQTDADPEAFGKAIAARLTQSTDALPHDITERLKAARAQAVARRRVVAVEANAVEVSFSGAEASIQMGGGEGGWWDKVSALVPLFALVAGLMTIGFIQDEMRADQVAEVDAELLTDVLPPAAYTDPGFAQYLQIKQNN